MCDSNIISKSKESATSDSDTQLRFKQGSDSTYENSHSGAKRQEEKWRPAAPTKIDALILNSGHSEAQQRSMTALSAKSSSCASLSCAAGVCASTLRRPRMLSTVCLSGVPCCSIAALSPLR